MKSVQKIDNKNIEKEIAKTNCNSKNISVNKDMFIVHQKILEQSLGHMLQAVNKEAQSVLVPFH